MLSRLGVGTLFVDASVVLPFLGGFLITANGTALTAGTVYGVKTSLGAFSATLPQLSTVTPGAIVMIEDVDYNAGVNALTVNAFAGDQISDHGVLAASTLLNISNTVLTLMADSTVAPYTVASQWVVVTVGS